MRAVSKFSGYSDGFEMEAHTGANNNAKEETRKRIGYLKGQ
jgi:hypothetical protein